MGTMQRKPHAKKGNMQWSRPMGLKTLSQVFDIHRNTMSKWLREQVICNQQLSARKWRIAAYELPNEIEDEKFVESLFH